MKLNLQKQKRQKGSVLVVTLIVGVVLLIGMSSYLQLVSVQTVSVARSQLWNDALTVAEAGIEEGLAQMNNSPNQLSKNLWGKSGANFGPVTRDLAIGSFGVMIVTNPAPTVYSTGYVTVPVSGAVVARRVKVTVAPQPLIGLGLGTVFNIDFNGNGIAVNSWDSSNPSLSTNGRYDSSKTSTNGDVASQQGLVNIGNHTIQGNLYLGPTASYVSNTGQVSGKIYSDYNVQIPDVELPVPDNGNWLVAPSSGSGGSQVHDFQSSGYYWVNDSAKIIVEAGVTVTLDVRTSSFNPAAVEILGGVANSGSLNVYQESGSMTVAGNTAATASLKPQNLYYFGLPGVTSITFSGNSTFTGVIYAPEAALTLNGGGGNNGLVGAAITKSVQMNANYDIHYDESLARTGPIRTYVASSWQEF